MQNNSQLISYLIAGAVIVLILALRLRRIGKARPLRLEQLWVLPAIYLVLCGVLFFQNSPSETGWLLCLGAVVVGGIIGWYRGRTNRITVDPETQTLNQTSSPAAIIFLVVLILLRLGLRSFAADEAQALHLSANTIVDVFLALALGAIAVQRLEMFLRARRLLAEAAGTRLQAPEERA